MREPVEEQRAVRQAGERVVEGLAHCLDSVGVRERQARVLCEGGEQAPLAVAEGWSHHRHERARGHTVDVHGRARREIAWAEVSSGHDRPLQVEFVVEHKRYRPAPEQRARAPAHRRQDVGQRRAVRDRLLDTQQHLQHLRALALAAQHANHAQREAEAARHPEQQIALLRGKLVADAGDEEAPALAGVRRRRPMADAGQRRGPPSPCRSGSRTGSRRGPGWRRIRTPHRARRRSRPHRSQRRTPPPRARPRRESPGCDAHGGPPP